MERFLQYLDELDDLYGAIGLVAERIRHIVWFVGFVFLLLVTEAAGIMLTLWEPPLGLATAIILFTALMYRAVTEPGLEISR